MKYLPILLLFFVANTSFAQWNSEITNPKNNLNNIFQKAQFDNPDLAAQYEFEITKNPTTGEISQKQRIKAFEKTQKILSQNKSGISDISWIERGPQNVSGRTRAIMFDPNYASNQKVWAAGITGGLWYNTDIENNGAWHNIGSFWDNIAVSTIVYNPVTPEIFFAGTGEGWTSSSVRGAGIWRSTDSGNSWNRLTSTDNSDFYNTQKIVVSNTGRVIASTNSGLFISDDNGDNWTKALDGFFGDIEITANGTIFASQGKIYNAGTVYRSVNNGDNWTDLAITTDITERTEIASAPSNPNTIYAVSSAGRDVSWFKKSIDNGDNWTDIEIPMYLDQNCSESTNDFTRSQAWYDLTIMVNPNDEQTVYVGGIDWHKTTDGGTSWEAVSYWTGGCEDYVHADQHAMVFFPNDNTKALVGCDGGIFLITDMITDFTSTTHLNNNYNVTQFYGCAMENISASNYMLAGAQDNGTQKFTQIGFGATSQATGGDGGLCFIDQDDSQIQITSYVYNNWRLSTNGGNSFSYYPNTTNGSFINPADYDSESNVLYASSTHDTIFISDIYTDGANGNYTPIINGLNNSSISSIKVSNYSTDVLYVGTYSGNIYRISNAKTNPTSTNIDPNAILPLGRISSIDIGENENKILLTYSSYGIESVWQTLNGGTYWTNIEYNLPDMPIRGCLYNPSNTNQILLATETGIWSINDISTETVWQPSNSGLANVRCDQLRYRTSDKLVAVATYGRGLFTSDIFSAPEPAANFMADKTVSCPTDTVRFTDYSTKNPTSWLWSFSPNTVTFLDGTDENSQNPIVQFNNTGNYTIELTATNSNGFGTLNKTNYILINEDCHYPINNGSIYTCNGYFFDNGYTEDYANGEDYTMTVYPNDPNPDARIKVEFTMFDIESHTNCAYDYLNIYDGENTSATLIGQYCGTNSPGIDTAENNTSGALTFQFHSDAGAVEQGWEASILCDTHFSIKETKKDIFQVYPNPAKNIINVKSRNSITSSEVKLYSITGALIYQSSFINSKQIDVSSFEQGIYILRITSEQNTIQKSIIIE